MSGTPPVTLEITLAPPDLRHVRHVLPHQLRTWAAQVSEILCVLDLRPVPGAPAPSWESDGRLLEELVDDCCTPYAHAHTRVVDYGSDVADAIAARFLGDRPPPAKTYRGGPFYAYFFGLLVSRYDSVLHLDSDMMFGGGSQRWVDEALDQLHGRSDALVCQPYPCPPRPDGVVFNPGAEPEAGTVPALRFQTITTRYFLIDLRRFDERIGSLGVRAHAPAVRRVGLHDWLRGVGDLPFRDRLRPLRLATPRIDLPERLLGEAMAAAGMYRLDYLGSPPGMWVLHPRERTDAYYAVLPQLVERIERGDVTKEQRGHYDLHESMLRPASRRFDA
jgi:hypothetical protein